MNCVWESQKFSRKNVTLNMLDVPIEITPWDGPINEIQVPIKSEVRPCPGGVG